VDDDPLGRKLVALRLRDEGFAVETSGTAEDALGIAVLAPPAAILSDVRMPGMDGFQLCRAVRRDPRLARIPIVLLSTAVEEADRSRALDAGADGLLVRTPDMRGILDALARVLGRAEGAG
jgi:two-component system phosphate regulon response regulator PhoB